MKKFYSFLIAAIIMLAIPMGMNGQTTYEQLTSIADIDENAQYVLGIDGTGFHYSNTSGWGLTGLPADHTPYYYKLVVAEDGESFKAYVDTPIYGNTYYMTIPTSNAFLMSTNQDADNTDLIIGTTQVSGTNYAVANKTTTARHLRINGTSGLRSYAGTTGSMAFFYKVVTSGTSYTVTYHANVTGTNDIEVVYGEGDDVTVADNTFTNLGYVFTEWNTEADGSGDSYAPNDVIEDIDDDLDLYAQWEESSEITLTFPLNSNPGGWPTTQSSTLTEYTYALGGVNYTFALQNVKCGSGYLMIYYVGAVGLPAIEGYKLTKVVASNSGGCSTSVIVGISSSASQANYIAGGAAQTWSTQSSQYTYNLTSTDANTMYYLYVTNKNAQVTSLALTYEAVDANSPSITASDVNINYNATSGSIAYTIENEPSPVGTLTASTTASWLTIGTATSSAVPFTCTANDNLVSRTATVTLTYAYDNSTVTKDIIVTQGVDETLGTADNPYTVAQARAFIDGLNGATSTEKYVSGIISQIDSYNSNFNSITYWISDDGTTTNQLEVYSGKGINGAIFSSINDVELTAEVIVKGNLKKYNTTYEFDKNNELVVYNAPQHDVEAPTFSPVAGTYAEAQTVTLSCATETATIFYTIDGTDPATSNTTQQYENPIIVSSTMTIKAVAVMGQYTSTIASATYHICSAENPYTVTEALAFSEYPANSIFVTGIVSTAPTSLSSGTLTYYISVDGEATNQLEVYKGKNLNNEAFTAVDDIQVGDIVTVYGNVQVYNSTIEFGSGNYLVSFERPTSVLEEYDLTVSTLDDHISAIYVFNIDEPNDPLIEEGQAGTIQVLEGTGIMVSPDVEEGYVLASLTVLDSEGTSVQPEDHMSDGGYYSFTMPSGPVTITATAMEAPATVDYELYSGALVEGDYIIYYNGYAMNHTVTSGRLQYETVTPNNNVITTYSAEIVWHIAPSATEGYWTIYSDDAQAYAAGTGVKNKAQMLAELNDDNNDMALWSVTVAESKDNTYEFVNKYNDDNNINHLLRNNGTNGFACYASQTGGALSLYKKVEASTETYDLTINGYGDNDQVTNGWYLIASPVATTPDQVENMRSNTYDLYRFNSTAIGAEWENYKNEEHNGFSIVPGQGYLYANSGTVTLKFSGDLYYGDGIITLENAGWNLVGNPYYETTTNIERAFYRMNSTNDGLIAGTANDNVNAWEGIFVEAAEAGETVTFTPATGAKSSSNASVVMNLSSNSNVIDRAIVNFAEGRQLSKFQLFDNSTKLCIVENGKEFAIANAEAQGEMPVNFKAATNGTYTISVNTENVSMGYLHLIDNLTGNNVDLLATPSYTFNATTTDYASRFKLVFSTNDTDSDDFAFISDGSIILNGQGNVQVFDITGRMISSHNDVNSITTNGMAAGVYMLRLVNGDVVKTQKIVVR